MYKFLRNYGLVATFVLHWLLYYFALLNNMMDWGFCGKFNYSIQWGSLPLLGLGIAFTFHKCMDDCNVKFLNACMVSMAIRFFVIVFKPWGFDSSSVVMLMSAVVMVLFFLYEYFLKIKSNDYFKY